jgi:hypothetical protein
VRRAPAPALDLGVYVKAVPLLVRNPAIIVIPLLMAVIAVLVGMVTSVSSGGFIGGTTSGLAGFIVTLLQLFGLGAACLMADDAWRNGKASFDQGWSEARRRGGDILLTALGVTLIFSVAQYAGILIGNAYVGWILAFVVAVFLIFSIPAAAVGGVPGGAGIQASIDRVRAEPLPAILATIVTFALLRFAVPYLTLQLWTVLAPSIGDITIVYALIGALLQAVVIGYNALVLTKIYTDAAFTRRW